MPKLRLAMVVLSLPMIFSGPALCGSFGDGYKSAKWGMTPAQVKEAIQSDGSGWNAGEPEKDSAASRLMWKNEKRNLWLA